MIKVSCNFDNALSVFIKQQLEEVLPSGCCFVGAEIELEKDVSLNNKIVVKSDGRCARIAAGTESNVLCGCFWFLERHGFVFGFSGIEASPSRIDAFLPMKEEFVPDIEDRGIRMHLNFVQDQSCFTESEFASFIDNIARMKFNHLLFHMYNCQEWFPFSYRGVKHLDLSIGNLKRAHLKESMIGRDKIKTKDHWFPREFEEITDPEELMQAMYGRYSRMMRRARERGMKVAVSFEPETLGASFESHLREWCEEDIKINRSYSLVNEWQQNWSGQKLVEADVCNPVVRDIALERAVAIVNSFPDLNELHFISREGTNYKCSGEDEYKEELRRIAQKFGFTITKSDFERLAERVKKGDVAINTTCDPYWTVREGENHYATVTASLRFVELSVDLIRSEKLSALLKEKNIKPVITLYQPDPKTIKLVAPFIAAMLKDEIDFHYLGDYGAKDIASAMDNVQPLLDAGNRVGCISWLEFDGSMMLLQGWCNAIAENVRRAKALGICYMSFNHWRVRGNEHNAKIAAETCFRAEKDALGNYCAALYAGHAALAKKAYLALEKATCYAKEYCFNIGFTADWVVRICTEPPGYSFVSLKKLWELYARAQKCFEELASQKIPAKKQACYLADMCNCSVKHVKGVTLLQSAKLPLVGFWCWPLTLPCKNIPPVSLTKKLLFYAEKGLEEEYAYMRLLADWTESCDQQGQLALHQQGLIEPFEELRDSLKGWIKGNA